MNVKTEQIMTISEANQNFSRVARQARTYGDITIFKNNKPDMMLISLVDKDDEYLSALERLNVEVTARKVMKNHAGAFEQLSK